MTEETSPHPDDYKKLLMTDAEYEAYVKDRFVIDETTGEIVGERLSPYQQALLEGVDWYDFSDLPDDFDDNVTGHIPACILDPKKSKDHGSER